MTTTTMTTGAGTAVLAFRMPAAMTPQTAQFLGVTYLAPGLLLPATLAA